MALQMARHPAGAAAMLRQWCDDLIMAAMELFVPAVADTGVLHHAKAAFRAFEAVGVCAEDAAEYAAVLQLSFVRMYRHHVQSLRKIASRRWCAMQWTRI